MVRCGRYPVAVNMFPHQVNWSMRRCHYGGGAGGELSTPAQVGTLPHIRPAPPRRHPAGKLRLLHLSSSLLHPRVGAVRQFLDWVWEQRPAPRYTDSYLCNIYWYCFLATRWYPPRRVTPAGHKERYRLHYSTQAAQNPTLGSGL